jgi:O-glycosyl hydrolase
MKNLFKFLGLVVITAMIGFTYFGCAQDASDGSSTAIGQNAAAPNITIHPTSRYYEPGAAILPLQVRAAASDGGAISYQWYQNTVFGAEGAREIPGETGQSYAVPQTPGDTYYYALVTNYNGNAPGNKTASAISGIALIRVQAGSTTGAPPSKTITINAADRQQYIRGFGGMSSVLFSDSAGSPDINAEELDILFNKDGEIRLNMLRILMPPDLESHVATPGTDGQDNTDYFDLVKLVNRNGGYVFACPWTPPAYFKTNDSLTGGGHVRPGLYVELALFFQTYLAKMADKGAPIYAISVQNEPNFTATYDGCEYTPEEMRDFIKILGPVLEDTPGYGGGVKHDKIKIMTAESANTPTLLNEAALNDPDSAKFIDIIPRHYYGNVQAKYDKALNMGKEVWQTEYSDTTGQSSTLYPYFSTWSYVWPFLNWIDCSQRLNNESAFVWWYSKRFYGLIGDGLESGPPEKTITHRGYAMAHYARFATDTTRVGITTDITSINNLSFSAQSSVPKCTAYESMDGNSYSMVIFTPAASVNAPGEGTGSVDLGEILVNLPAGFTATSAYAMKSNMTEKLAYDIVVLNADGNSAVINVPRNSIISVKFSK